MLVLVVAAKLPSVNSTVNTAPAPVPPSVLGVNPLKVASPSNGVPDRIDKLNTPPDASTEPT